MHHRRKASILRFILLFLYLNDRRSRDALFANCLFWDAFWRVAFLRYASLRDAFLRVGSLRDDSLRVAFLRVTSLRDAFLCVASLRYAFLRVGSLRDASACCFLA